jgi:hypothetical protein
MRNEHIVGLRPVHEILRAHTRRTKVPIILSFIQWGNPEEGYKYENVCPFCAATVGYVEEEKDEVGPVEMFMGELTRKLQEQMSTHLLSCTASGYRLAVQLAKHPLNTEKLPTEH